jgi:hypothetical protein
MKTIYEKMLAVRAKVGNIPKSGFNNFSKYKYVTKDTLYDYFRAYFEEEKLLVLTSTEIIEHKIGQTAKGESTNRTMVQQKHIIINAEKSEEKIEVFSVGTGEDKGDKDIYQADTGAMKYFLIDNFFVSGGDSFPGDVEHDKKSETVKKKEIAPNIITLKTLANKYVDKLSNKQKQEIRKIVSDGKLTDDAINVWKETLEG